MKLKSAFTLAEIFIFLIIVSVLISILFVSWKPKQAVAAKNVKYKYAAVYDALNIALYGLSDKDDTNPFVVEDDDPVKGFKKLCNGLADYINTSETNCDIQPLSTNVAYAKDENFDFKNLKPHLTSLTGINFYISELIKDDKEPKNERSYFNAANPEYDLKFYMVYADINAKDNHNRVHSIKYTGKDGDVPDVFAFAVIPTGAAIPMGVAEYNIKYVQTKIVFSDSNGEYYSPLYSYAQAKHTAWGWYGSGNSEKSFKEKISFTYNDFIKEILQRKSSQLYKFQEASDLEKTFTNPLFSKCVPPYGTPLKPYDMCRIMVDTPNFGMTN